MTPKPQPLSPAGEKRKKAKGREVSPLLLMVELRHELEARIFDLERRVKYLEGRDDARGMSGMMIGGSDVLND